MLIPRHAYSMTLGSWRRPDVRARSDKNNSANNNQLLLNMTNTDTLKITRVFCGTKRKQNLWTFVSTCCTKYARCTCTFPVTWQRSGNMEISFTRILFYLIFPLLNRMVNKFLYICHSGSNTAKRPPNKPQINQTGVPQISGNQSNGLGTVI